LRYIRGSTSIQQMKQLFCFATLVLAFVLCGQTKISFLQITREGSLQEQFDAHIRLLDFYDYDNQDSALISSLKLVQIAKEIKSYDLLAEAHKSLSISYRGVGLYDYALTNSYRAIEYYDSANTENNRSKIADIYHNIGWILTYQEDFEKTAGYFHKAMDLRGLQTRTDSVNQAHSFDALGNFYFLYQDHFDSADYYLNLSIMWRKKLNVPLDEIARVQVELGHAYLLARNYDSAAALMKSIRDYPQDSISNYVQTYAKFLDGLLLHQRGDFQGALLHFEVVHSWLIESGNEHSDIGINALRQMVETAGKGKLHEKAFEYLSLLRTVERESIYKDRQRTTRALEVVNETGRKEQLIQIQEKQITLQNQIIWITLSGLGIILVLALFLLRSRKKVKTRNERIEILMRELHHRVKNNLQIISSLLGLQSMKLKDVVAKQAVSEGKQRIKAMSLIHQKLYQQNEVSALDIHEYITDLVNDLADSFGFRAKGEVKIDVPSMTLNADTSLPLGLIINELVTNSFKYAYDNVDRPILELKMIHKGNRDFLLVICDNGLGLPVDFDLANAESFGLKLVNILISQIGGTINCEQHEGLKYMISFQSS
jgi:two-component system, sensor histidine kinase PdtaS